MTTLIETKVVFHDVNDATSVLESSIPTETRFTYTFENFFHPLVGSLLEQLNKKSIAGLLDADAHKNWKAGFFKTVYDPVETNTVGFTEFPQKEIDVGGSGAYANYNWELLFHIPFAIAVHLSKNQRFSEAQRWFHYILDPGDRNKKYWKFLRFRQTGEVMPIDDQLALFGKTDPTAEDEKLKAALIESYKEIKKKPGRGDLVAQARIFPYQYAVAMKYLDNLIAWGDSLFQQDTIESINEATQLYVLASNFLGARPQRIPPQGRIRPKTFHELKHETDEGLDAFSNAIVELEGQFPFNFSTPPGSDSDDGPQTFGSVPSLYFCVPPNEKLLGYWDIVADRLFKIRNCMNIEGVVRQLALFDPPLDPGMLVKAAAAGISIGSVLSGLNQPVGPVRALVMIQKALELAGEVRGLGAAHLSAIEKGDGEKLALLRQSHEIKIQKLSEEVRFLQWKQAQASTESLVRSRATALERFAYYHRLLGVKPDSSPAAERLSLDRRELTEENFDEAYGALVGQYDKAVAAPAYPQRATKEEGTLRLIVGEYDELNGHADRAFAFRTAAAGTETVTAALSMIPDLNIAIKPFGTGSGSAILGGEMFARAGRAVTAGLSMLAQNEDWQGAFASKVASYERRADGWVFEANLAANELMQIGRQILGSLIAEQAAHREYLNIQKQIEHSEEVDQFLREKYTSEELYAWMQGEISRLYYEYYRFAFDTARKAEQTMKRELMRPELGSTDYVKFNYWDGGRKGLLSGEALYLDVKRLEMAYLENNRRELELTKHVSLRQLNPLALLALKAGGQCEVSIPEWLYDLDCPGHYMRRIKMVSLSIPSVAGPYTSVSCTLSLLRSSLRKSPLAAKDEYARKGSEDDRFDDYFGTIQSIVTSGGNNDSGMFEPNLRDERILPFEGAGAASTWKLELPASFRQFDYDTISDVILHVRYTARQGGEPLGKEASNHLKEIVGKANTAGLALLFSLKHDFPTEWHKFVGENASKPNPTIPFSAKVKREYFPYFTQGKVVSVDAIQIVAVEGNGLNSVTSNAALDTFTNDLKVSGEATFSPAITGPVADVLRPEKAVFILIRYSLAA